MLDFITKNISGSSSYRPVAQNIFKAYNRARPEGPKDLICYVPFNSLTFSWLGKVYACTYNRNILVGEYPENSPENRVKDCFWTGTSPGDGENLRGVQGSRAYTGL